MKRHLDETEVRPNIMGNRKAKRGIPSKSENFNEWYPFIVEAAELVDKRYPIKGMDVWRPYGWKTMKLIDALTHAEMERTNHEEVNFPLLIPENLLEKENALVARLKRAREEGVDPDDLRDEDEEGGFKKEVYWVKHAGDNDLDIPMFLRPTSETAMYTMFPLWIRSHKDLPLKIYQMVNTFRYETKQTRSFIRVREIHFFEAHTAHADEEDASRQISQDLEIVDRLMHDLCLPIIKAKRPVWDTFPGAWYTIGIDAVMPNGRTLQVASCHHYRDQWAKAFDVTYEDLDAKQAFCHQTTYGMSERLLGAVVGMHGDENGLIMPPKIAPLPGRYLSDDSQEPRGGYHRCGPRGGRETPFPWPTCEGGRPRPPSRAEVLRLGNQRCSTPLGHRASGHRSRHRLRCPPNGWQGTASHGQHRGRVLPCAR